MEPDWFYPEQLLLTGFDMNIEWSSSGDEVVDLNGMYFKWVGRELNDRPVYRCTTNTGFDVYLWWMFEPGVWSISTLESISSNLQYAHFMSSAGRPPNEVDQEWKYFSRGTWMRDADAMISGWFGSSSPLSDVSC